jgi:plasmid maintenance system killer protein
MIVRYGDKRTERFAAGDHVKEFSGFARQAELRLNRLEAATSVADLAGFRGNRLERMKGDRSGQFYPHQRSVADLLFLAARIARTGRCRNLRLPLKELEGS